MNNKIKTPFLSTVFILYVLFISVLWLYLNSRTHKVELEVKTKDIEKLIDGGFVIHINGISDGGIPISVIYETPTLQKFLETEEKDVQMKGARNKK